VRSLIRNFNKAWYYLRCWVWHRYNRVHIKTLSPTWIDRDTVLVHAMFQVLSDFIEREKPQEVLVTEGGMHDDEWKEIFRLYNWWKNVALKFDSMHDYDTIEHKPLTFENMNESHTEEEQQWWNEVRRREQEFEVELLANMKRLCELRGMLWT